MPRKRVLRRRLFWMLLAIKYECWWLASIAEAMVQREMRRTG